MALRVLGRDRSLLRSFALLSLLVIAVITAVQVTVEWRLLRENLLDWERTTTAAAIRADAYAVLQPHDFVQWHERAAQARFADFFRHAQFNKEILRVKLYGPDLRVVWSDEPRLLGARFPGNAPLRRALAGETVAHLEQARKAENIYERGFARTVEMYVPLSFPGPSASAAPAVAGVVEIYKDPAPMFVNVTRDRVIIILTSLAGALVLYGSLFWIVRRASRQLEAQRTDLQRQTSALQQANDELRATQQQLRAAERLAAIGEVSAAVAHGIRNPLANIRASAQVALEAPGPSVKTYLETITAEVDRLGRWLRGLLDAARPFEPRFAPLDVNGVVRAALSVLQERMARDDVALTRILAADLPKIRADEVHLEQAFVGVLENALDAMPGGGGLEVRTDRWGGDGSAAVRVQVRDSGEGIPAERLARVFDAFFTSKPRGTGLGLAITRKVIEAHGGRVEIDSRVGRGTTVTMLIPVVPGPEGRG
jgi:signal transduction histidine kinase